MTETSDVAARLDAVRETMRTEFTREHADPWVVAYSGGKDSTLLLQLVWEVAAAVPAGEPRRPIYVVSNDTLVESPLVIRHLRQSLDVIRQAVRTAGLPITVKMTEPCIDQTFWVNVIGRGYIPLTRNFRWCTDRMKIAPTNDVIRKIVLFHKRAVLLVGTRKSAPAEIEMIDDIWRRDRICEEGRLSLLAAVGIKPDPLPEWLRRRSDVPVSTTAS